jgi:hypothetical protein
VRSWLSDNGERCVVSSSSLFERLEANKEEEEEKVCFTSAFARSRACEAPHHGAMPCRGRARGRPGAALDGPVLGRAAPLLRTKTGSKSCRRAVGGKGRSGNEGGVAGVSGGPIIFRGASQKSETKYLKQNRKFVRKCSLGIFGRPSEQGQFSTGPLKSKFWGPDSRNRGFFSAYYGAPPQNLKPHLNTNF